MPRNINSSRKRIFFRSVWKMVFCPYLTKYQNSRKRLFSLNLFEKIAFYPYIQNYQHFEGNYNFLRSLCFEQCFCRGAFAWHVLLLGKNILRLTPETRNVVTRSNTVLLSLYTFIFIFQHNTWKFLNVPLILNIPYLR